MKQIVLFFLCLLFFKVNAQYCGTPQPTNPIIYPTQEKTLESKESSSALCINVFFHIVRNSNGINAFVPPNTDDIVEDLNEFYSTHNIIINNLGSSFINNTNFVNIGNQNEATSLGQVNNNSNAINYYIVEELWDIFDANGNPIGTVAGTANSIPSNNLVIRSDRVLTTTSAHELGHCLNLLHTFQGTAPNTSGCAENINGSNCSTCGDLVCDTPADSNQGATGGFSPDLTNIMSYYNNRDHLTDRQGFRMRYAIRNEPVLQNIESSSCAAISEINTICYPQTTTVTITNLGNATTTWTSSNNVQIISSNNSSAVIRAASSYFSGNGWIRAELNNGITFEEEFHVGKAEVDNVIFINSIGDTGYFCSSHYDNEFEILPKVPDDSYQIRIRDLSTFNIVAGPYTFTGNIATLPNSYNYTPGWYLFEVKGTNPCGTTNWSEWEVEFVDCTLGGGGGEMEYMIYPNPSTDFFTIKKSSINSSKKLSSKTFKDSNQTYFEIYDFTSNLIYKNSLRNQISVNVSKYKKGIYFLKIYFDGKIEIQRLVIE